MLEFKNERIINSDIDAYSGLPKFEKLDSNTFRIYRYGTFDTKNIIGRTIYKTKSSKPVKPYVEITVPGSIIPAAGETKNIRLNVDLRLSGSVNSEYSTYSSRVKGKPVRANLKITSNDTAAKIAAALVEILERQDMSYDNLRINCKLKTNGSATIVLTGENEFQYFNDVTIEELVPWNNAALGNYYPVEPVWEPVASYDTGTKIDGQEGFGTYFTMLKNVQIQTSNRTDVFSQDNDDTALVKGASYTQYVLDYRVVRDITGMGAVGEELVSITKHIMWVNDNLVSDFDNLLQSVGVIINDVDLNITALSVTPAKVTVSVGNTSDLTITTTPAGGMYYTESLDESVATINGKTITGVSAGSTQVIVNAEDGNIKQVEVTVTA